MIIETKGDVMRTGLLMTLAVTTGVLAAGYDRGPAEWENGIVDRMFESVRIPLTQEAGLASLERIAEGHPEGVDPAVGAAAGLKQEPSALEAYRFPEVRAHALYKIAETGIPEAIEYLSRLKPGDLGKDSTQQLDQAIGLSYRQALYLQEKDPQRRIEFLEAALEERSMPAANGAVALWAWNTLCDEGEVVSLPPIEKSIRWHYSGQPGEDMIRFCETRMRIVRGDPDRVKALSTVLKITSDPEARNLIYWAVGQLESMRSAEADLALERYAAAINALPERSPEWNNLFGTADRIRHLVDMRRAVAKQAQ
jgi:hypothetical protein